jgi:NTP pyrophosphatase (non-canonical NTP hydrolase)
VTRTEHLLVILAEECAEVAQRTSKALRFGLDEVQPGQTETNAQRISGELADVFAAVDMLINEGVIAYPDIARTLAKQKKVEEFLRYSAECGTLTPDAQAQVAP